MYIFGIQCGQTELIRKTDGNEAKGLTNLDIGTGGVKWRRNVWKRIDKTQH